MTTEEKTTTTTVPLNLLFRNENYCSDFPPDIGAHDFLKLYPRGGYTTMRTFHVHSVFEYNFHIHRLMYSQSQVLFKSVGKCDLKEIEFADEEKEEGFYPLAILYDFQKFKQICTNALNVGIKKYCDMTQISLNDDTNEDIPNNNDNNNWKELKLTILINCFRKKGDMTSDVPFIEETMESITNCKYIGFDVYLHITEMEELSQPISVDMMPGSRVHLANIKDSNWVLERDPLNKRKHKTCQEVLMCENDGIVREGISSNFFVISQHNHVMTAKEGILFGSVRAAIIPTKVQDVLHHSLEKDCDTILTQEGINYFEKNPNLSDLIEWKEAFITSTSRLLLPIRTIHISKECIDEILPKDKAREIQLSGRLTDSDDERFYTIHFEQTYQGEKLGLLLKNNLLSKKSERVVFCKDMI
ncbi:hypothetical protein C9374_011157 [Naegleria lovaniensis]|uniref:Uncharacterized protein n=1 Tax=Naegleria lovaniensis TaxID=51637 RepID=A0AA88GF72_NAELO|nr:uncharacterized protein C9374_011157 [Naegleria lovaniensis]KAG2374078.1 hypothetical protein C9374_011157 [Naegleria lovaniensis]